MDHYGALEIGVHRFYPEDPKLHEPVGEGRFVELWKKVDHRWLLERVISYDHHPVAN
jgi:hypothetical protein